MQMNLCTAMLACALVGACADPGPGAPSAATPDPCVDYGFARGTSGHRKCSAREAEARRQGRMDREYNGSAVVADAQATCIAYGIAPSSIHYDRCLQREISSREPQ